MKHTAWLLVSALLLSGCQNGSLSINRRSQADTDVPMTSEESTGTPSAASIEKLEPADPLAEPNSTTVPSESQVSKSIVAKEERKIETNELQVQISDLNAQATQLTEQNKILSEKNNELAKMNPALVKENQDLLTKQEELKKSNDKLLTENKILLRHFEELKKSVEALETGRKGEEAKAASLKAQISKLETILNDLSVKHKKVQEESESFIRRHDAVRKQISEFESIRDRLKSDLANLQTTLKRYEGWPIFKEASEPASAATATKDSPPSTTSEATVRKEIESSAKKATPPLLTAPPRLVCPVIADSYLIENQPTANKGAAPGMAVGFSKQFGSLAAIMRFDLSGIPKDLPIRRAIVRALHFQHHDEDGSLDISIWQITEPWNEKAAGWAGVSVDNQPLTFIKASKTGEWLEWDITPLVKSWQSGKPNCGIMLRAAVEDTGKSNYFVLGSKETKGQEPVLEILLENPDNPQGPR